VTPEVPKAAKPHAPLLKSTAGPFLGVARTSPFWWRRVGIHAMMDFDRLYFMQLGAWHLGKPGYGVMKP
jgi:hypothetical protein